MLYFDHNATAPLLPQARQAWLEAEDHYAANPSSPHRLGQRAETALQRARAQLAGFLGCDGLDLVWTSGATESNNMVFHHAARAPQRDAEVWLSAIEHPCVLAAANKYFPRRVHLIPVNRTGVTDLNWLESELRQRRPGLVAVMAANNETGVLQPWREALALCREQEVPFFCDAAQWIGKLPAAGLGACDFVSGCAHKFGGPKGVGFLKCPTRSEFFPLLVGGPQEDGRRAGTENVASVLSMLVAFETRENQLSAEGTSRRLECRVRFEQRLVRELPGSKIVGAGAERLWNTVSAVMPEADGRSRWVVKLDKIGYAVSTGSACASGKEEPSHVLSAMGYPSAEASRVLRFSSAWETTEANWASLLTGLRQANDLVAPAGRAAVHPARKLT